MKKYELIREIAAMLDTSSILLGLHKLNSEQIATLHGALKERLRLP